MQKETDSHMFHSSSSESGLSEDETWNSGDGKALDNQGVVVEYEA